MKIARTRLLLVVIAISARFVSAQSASGRSLACKLATEPQTVIGYRVGTEIGRLAGAVIVHDTIIAVADALSRNVTLHSASGLRLAQIGRSGQGPGEFRSIQRLSTKADTIVVYDPTARRVSLLSVASGFVRSFQHPWGFAGLIGDDIRLTTGAAAAEGRGRSGPEVWPDTLEVRIEQGDRSRLITRVADRTRLVDLTQGISVMFAPYTSEPKVTFGNAEIIVADGTGEIRRFMLTGAPKKSLNSPFVGVKLTSADLANWIEHSVSEASPQLKAGRRKLLSAAPLPPRAPAHGPVVVDRMGRVWLQEYRAPHDARPSQVAVLDANGDVVLRAMIAARARLLASSPRVALIGMVDQLDVESIAVLRVECTSRND